MKARTWFRVHSWLGVVTGLLLFVICWSGTVATVSHEIDWLLDPAKRVEPGERRSPWGDIEHAVRIAYPAAERMSFSAPLYSRAAAQVVVDLPHQKSLRVSVNPYTAEVLGDGSYFNVQRFFRSFHMNLFSGKWGYYTVFSFGLVLLMSFVTPLVFYKRWWRRFFVLKTDKGGRVFWSDVHKLVGLWSLWFVLAIAVTGVWYLFEALRSDVGDGKGVWTATFKAAVHRLPTLDATAPHGVPLTLDALLARAKQARPDLDIRNIYDDSGYLYIDGQAEHYLVRDRANKLYLDPRDGRVVFDQRASDQPLCTGAGATPPTRCTSAISPA